MDRPTKSASFCCRASGSEVLCIGSESLEKRLALMWRHYWGQRRFELETKVLRLLRLV